MRRELVYFLPPRCRCAILSLLIVTAHFSQKRNDAWFGCLIDFHVGYRIRWRGKHGSRKFPLYGRGFAIKVNILRIHRRKPLGKDLRNCTKIE